MTGLWLWSIVVQSDAVMMTMPRWCVLTNERTGRKGSAKLGSILIPLSLALTLAPYVPSSRLHYPISTANVMEGKLLPDHANNAMHDARCTTHDTRYTIHDLPFDMG